MTKKAFIAQLIELASAGLSEEETGFTTMQVEQIVPIIMQTLAEQCNDDPQRAHLLNKELQLTLDDSGIGDLASSVLANTATVTPPLLSTRPFDNVRDGDGNYLEFIPTLYDLQQYHSPQLSYYAIDQGKIHTKPLNFQPGAVLSNATITFIAPVEPTPETLHASLVPDALNLGVGFLRDGRQAMAAGSPGTQSGRGEV